MTRHEMMTRMLVPELLMWWSLEQIDPFGQTRDDLRFALLASQVASFAGVEKKGGGKFSIADLILSFPGLDDEPDDDDDDDSLDAVLSEQDRAERHTKRLERDIKAWVAAINARFKQPTPPPKDASNAS
jgi:hypothetical protein